MIDIFLKNVVHKMLDQKTKYNQQIENLSKNKNSFHKMEPAAVYCIPKINVKNQPRKEIFLKKGSKKNRQRSTSSSKICPKIKMYYIPKTEAGYSFPQELIGFNFKDPNCPGLSKIE